MGEECPGRVRLAYELPAFLSASILRRMYLLSKLSVASLGFWKQQEKLFKNFCPASAPPARSFLMVRSGATLGTPCPPPRLQFCARSPRPGSGWTSGRVRTEWALSGKPSASSAPARRQHGLPDHVHGEERAPSTGHGQPPVGVRGWRRSPTGVLPGLPEGARPGGPRVRVPAPPAPGAVQPRGTW